MTNALKWKAYTAKHDYGLFAEQITDIWNEMTALYIRGSR